MNKKIKFAVSLFLALIFVQQTDKANAINIDEFEGDENLFTSTINQPQTAVTLSASALGGRRSLYVNKTAGSGGISLYTADGTLTHDQGTSSSGVSIITWDGDDIADNGIPSNPLGLGGINLTEDNGGAGSPADAFRIKIKADLGFNQPVTVRIYVYSNLTSCSMAGITINSNTVDSEGNPIFEDFIIPYADFNQICGIGITSLASFNNVGAIVLEINGINPANDLEIQTFGTNGECPVIPQNGSAYGPCGCLDLGDFCLDCLDMPFGEAVPGTACESGEPGVCAEGTFQDDCSCESNITPNSRIEICDGLDNNCDGRIDEDLADICGECGGNGLSCLDCMGVPFGAAKVSDCCQQENVSELQHLLDHGAKLQEKLIKRMLKILNKHDSRKAVKNFSQKSAKRAFELQHRNWVLSWVPPSIMLICKESSICAQVSNLDILDEYRLNSVELRDIGNSVIRRLKRLKINTARFLKRNLALHEHNMKLADKFPVSRSDEC